MEFQELRAFAAVIEHGGFRKAATQLRLTQSAVSQSVANLEHKLGEKLIERARPLRPTLVGAELLGHAHAILGRRQDFLDDLERIKRGHLQTLSIAVDYLGNSRYALPAIERFVTTLPEADLRLHKMPGREVVSAVRDGAFDVGFSFFQRTMPGLRKVQLGQETSVLVAGKRDPNRRLYSHNPIDYLAKTTLLTSFVDAPQMRPSQRKIRDYFAKTWEIDNIAMQLDLIASGRGAAFVPQSLLETVPRPGRFVVLDQVPFARISKPYGAYYAANARRSLTLDTFVGALSAKH